MLILDVSFRDDARQFCAWESASALTNDMVHAWARHRFTQRFQHGTMVFERVEPECFIGLHTVWTHLGLRVWPDMGDPWGSAIYLDKDANPLRPFLSWVPPHQKKATISSLLCRCAYLSSCRDARRAAIWETMVAFLLHAGYPGQILKKYVFDWARNWKPKHGLHVDAGIMEDVAKAAVRLNL